MGGGLAQQRRRCLNVRLKGLAGELRINAGQLKLLAGVFGGDGLEIRLGDQRIHAHEHLTGTHRLALAHQDVLDDARFRGLHDLEIAGGHEFAVGHCHDVQPSQQRPDDEKGDQRQDGPQHPPPLRIGRAVLQTDERRMEIQRVAVGLLEEGFQCKHAGGLSCGSGVLRVRSVFQPSSIARSMANRLCSMASLGE